MGTDVNTSPTSSHYNMHTTLQLVGGMLNVGVGGRVQRGQKSLQLSIAPPAIDLIRREQDSARNCSWIQQTRG